MRSKLFSKISPAVLSYGAVCSGVGYYFGSSSGDSEDGGWKFLDKNRWFQTASAATAVSTPSLNYGGILGGGTAVAQSPVTSSKAQSAGQIMRYGYPSQDGLRIFNDFVLGFDKRTRNPAWVFEHLTKEKVEKNPSVNRDKCNFKEDSAIHPFFRSTNADYKGSGFDRGHMAAAGNHRRSQEATDETFSLSNMSPQVGKGFNRDKWNDLEQHVRKVVRKSLNTYVCTGPLFLPQKRMDGKNYVSYEVIGKQNVAVPTHYFKVILIETAPSQYELESYVMPNTPIPDATPITAFYAPVETIERAAGFLLFDQLPKGNNIKSINGKKGAKW